MHLRSRLSSRIPPLLPCCWLAVSLLHLEGSAQTTALKVFISADMEGIAGVVARDQTGSDGAGYAFGRSAMTAEVNAAIAAAFEAGATAVTVTDAHGSGTNLLATEVDRRAVLISGFPMPGGMMQGIDATYGAAVFIGYHARGITENGILAHTYTNALRTVKLNGHGVGEYGLNAAIAGHFGVPVVFVSGDRAAVEQAKEFIPGVITVAVKEGFGPTAGRTMHPEDAREQIARGVTAAVARRAAIAPVRLKTPVTLEIEFSQTSMADTVALIPGVERTGGASIRYVAPTMADAYRLSVLIDRITG
jgi:D-amino peptidase